MLEPFSSRGCIPLSTASGVSLTEVVTPGTCLHQENHWQRGWHQEPACRITFLILCSVPQPWVCCFLCEPKLTISRLDLISRLWWPLLFCPLVLPHLSLQPWTCCFLSRFVRRRASPQSLHYTIFSSLLSQHLRNFYIQSQPEYRMPFSLVSGHHEVISCSNSQCTVSLQDQKQQLIKDRSSQNCEPK